MVFALFTLYNILNPRQNLKMFKFNQHSIKTVIHKKMAMYYNSIDLRKKYQMLSQGEIRSQRYQNYLIFIGGTGKKDIIVRNTKDILVRRVINSF